MSLLHVGHELPEITVERDVLLGFQVSGNLDAARDHGLENTSHYLRLDVAKPLADSADVAVRRGQSSRGRGILRIARVGGGAADRAGPEVGRVAALRNGVGRFAGAALLVCEIVAARFISPRSRAAFGRVYGYTYSTGTAASSDRRRSRRTSGKTR